MAACLMIRLARKSGPISEDGGDDRYTEHPATARALPALDKLATAAGLPPLGGFVSEDPENVADLVDDEDEAEEILARLPPVRWWPPADALPTVERLRELVAADTGVVKQPAKVQAELADLATVLRVGVAKKATFRLYREF